MSKTQEHHCQLCGKTIKGKQPFVRHLEREKALVLAGGVQEDELQGDEKECLDFINDLLAKLAPRSNQVRDDLDCPYCHKTYTNKYRCNDHIATCSQNPLLNIEDENASKNQETDRLDGSEDEEISGDEENSAPQVQGTLDIPYYDPKTIKFRVVPEEFCVSLDDIDSTRDTRVIIFRTTLPDPAINSKIPKFQQRKEVFDPYGTGNPKEVNPLFIIKPYHGRQLLNPQNDYMGMLNHICGGTFEAFDFIKACYYRKIHGYVRMFEKIHLEGRHYDKYPFKIIERTKKETRLACYDKNGQLNYSDATDFIKATIRGSVIDCYILVASYAQAGHYPYSTEDAGHWQYGIHDHRTSVSQDKLLSLVLNRMESLISEQKFIERMQQNTTTTQPRQGVAPRSFVASSRSVEPHTLDAKPRAAIAMPPMARAKQPVASAKPLATSAKPPMASVKPPATSAKLPVASVKLPVTIAKPLATSAKLPVASATSSKPPVTNSKPLVTSAKPPMARVKPHASPVTKPPPKRV